MISLKIPEDITNKLFKVAVPGKRTPKEEMHITMFYFGEKLNIENTIKIIRCMYSVAKKSFPLKIKATTVSSFPVGEDGVPIIVPIISNDLLELRARLAKKFDKESVEYSKKWPEYKPHLTLSYSDKKIEDKKLTQPISWRASDIVLWAGSKFSEPGVVASVPLSTKQASGVENNYLAAQIFESLTKLS